MQHLNPKDGIELKEQHDHSAFMIDEADSLDDILTSLDDNQLLQAESSANKRLCDDLLNRMYTLYLKESRSLEKEFPNIDFDILFNKQMNQDFTPVELELEDQNNNRDFFERMLNEYLLNLKHQEILLRQMREFELTAKKDYSNEQKNKMTTSFAVTQRGNSTTYFTGFIPTIVKAIAVNLLCPLTYVYDGMKQLYEASTTQSSDGHRHIKIGTAVGIAALSFAYAGLAISVALSAVAGVSIAAGAALAAPFVLPVLLVPLAALGWYKQHTSANQTATKIRIDKMEMDNINKAIKINENKLENATPNTHPFIKQVYQDRIQMLSAHREILHRRIEKNKATLHSQNRLKSTGLLTTVGYVVAVFWPLFPPLALIGLGMVFTAMTIEAADQAKVLKASLTKQKQAKPQKISPKTKQEKERILGGSEVLVAKSLNPNDSKVILDHPNGIIESRHIFKSKEPVAKTRFTAANQDIPLEELHNEDSDSEGMKRRMHK